MIRFYCFSWLIFSACFEGTTAVTRLDHSFTAAIPQYAAGLQQAVSKVTLRYFRYIYLIRSNKVRGK